ncbi:MetQ/NlpA family ABC transporter substrate-binding protein [Candidatus Phytoplasma solani]|uniref:MetQ/NlpA family ABC transporter substrate-binding protein n=1 Tax=Candidatus Phytoplasma solani TaxID=69896 RepID=UPI0032D9B8A2
MFYLLSLPWKNKKNLLLVLFTLSLLVNFTLGYFYWNLKTHFSKQTALDLFPSRLKVATALSTVQNLLEGSVKKHLKKYHNITLEILYFPNGFNKTDELLANKEVDAKFDAHVHHLNIANQNYNNRLTFVQAGYLPKFSLFALNKDNNFKNLEDLKKFKKDNPNKKLKILMPNDNFQQSLSFYLLEQLGIIKKNNLGTTTQTFFELKPNFFESVFGFPEIQYETDELISITHKFLNGGYDLCLQYPTLMGNISNDVSVVETLKKPDELEDPIYSYTISLVARKDNEKSKEIKILQEVLKQEKIINEAQEGIFKGRYYMIPREKIDILSQTIKDKYLGKTSSAERVS